MGQFDIQNGKGGIILEEKSLEELLKEKFSLYAGEYDQQRKHVIPCLDDLYTIMADLARSEVPRPKVLDMGAGTGLLTQYLYEKFERAEFTLIDLSDEMLNIARQRFKGKLNFKYIAGDYVKYDFQDKFDIIASSLSIHHLHDHNKEFLYGKIYEILNEGGIFLNADQVLAPNPSNELEYQRNWREKIEEGSLRESEKISILERMKFDKPAKLEYNLKWLEKSGFNDVDVFYKYYNFCVLCGKKDEINF
jgi:tRNA (cmo5U34)-methyltransferase